MSILRSCLFLFWINKIFHILLACLILISSVGLIWNDSVFYIRLLYIFPMAFAIYSCGRVVGILNNIYLSKGYSNFLLYVISLYSTLLTIFCFLSLLQLPTIMSIILFFLLNSIIMVLLSSTGKISNTVILILVYVLFLLKVFISI